MEVRKVNSISRPHHGSRKRDSSPCNRPTSVREFLSPRDSDELRATIAHASFALQHMHSNDLDIDKDVSDANRDGAFLKSKGVLDVQARLSNFVAAVSSSFVPENKPINRVAALLGPIGCGKSALIANWIASFRRTLPDDCLILQHHICASEMSNLPIIVSRRLASILASLPNPPKSAAPFAYDQQRRQAFSDEKTCFQELLLCAAKTVSRVVVILDGIENIADEKFMDSKSKDGEAKHVADSSPNSNFVWLASIIRYLQDDETSKSCSNIKLICSASITNKENFASILGMNSIPDCVDFICMESKPDEDLRKKLILRGLIGRSRRRKKRTLLLQGAKNFDEINSAKIQDETSSQAQCLDNKISADASPRLINSIIRVLEALDGIVAENDPRRDRVISSVNALALFQNIEITWDIQTNPSTEVNRSGMPPLVFAGTILTASVVHASGMHPSEFVKLVRFVVCKCNASTERTKIKVSSKLILKLVNSFGFQSRIGGRVGGAHSDLNLSERNFLNKLGWGSSGGQQLQKQLCAYVNQMGGNGAYTPCGRTNLDCEETLKTCAGLYFISKGRPLSREDSHMACYYLSSGGSTYLLADVLSNIEVFNNLWSSGWRSQRGVLAFWKQILSCDACRKNLETISELPTLKEQQALDPVHKYQLSLTALMNQGTSMSSDSESLSKFNKGEDVTISSNPSFEKFGDTVYCVLDMLAELGANVEASLELPDFMFPLIPSKNFEEWHSATYIKYSEINVRNSLNIDIHSRKGVFKLYRRFMWSWFPVLAWVTPEVEHACKQKNSIEKKSNTKASSSPSAPVSLTEYSHEKEQNIAQVFSGISRRPLTEIGAERAALTSAQLKARLRSEKSHMNKTILTPRTLRDELAAESSGLLPSHQDALLKVTEELNANFGRQRKERALSLKHDNKISFSTQVAAKKSDIDSLVDQLFLTNGGFSDIEADSLLDSEQSQNTQKFQNAEHKKSNSLLMTSISTSIPNGSECLLPSLQSKYMMSPAVAKFVDAHLKDLPLTEEQARIAEARAITAELRRKLNSITLAASKKEELLNRAVNRAESRDEIDDKSHRKTQISVEHIAQLKLQLDDAVAKYKKVSRTNSHAKRALQVHRMFPSRDISHVRRLERNLKNNYERMQEQRDAIDNDIKVAQELRIGNKVLREETKKGIDMRLEALARGRARLAEQRKKAKEEALKAQQRARYRNVVLRLDLKTQKRMLSLFERVQVASFHQVETPSAMVQFSLAAHKSSRDSLRSEIAQLEANVHEKRSVLNLLSKELEQLKITAHISLQAHNKRNNTSLASSLPKDENQQEQLMQLDDMKQIINRLASQLWNHDETDKHVVETLDCIETELSARLAEIDELVKSGKVTVNQDSQILHASGNNLQKKDEDFVNAMDTLSVKSSKGETSKLESSADGPMKEEKSNLSESLSQELISQAPSNCEDSGNFRPTEVLQQVEEISKFISSSEEWNDNLDSTHKMKQEDRVKDLIQVKDKAFDNETECDGVRVETTETEKTENEDYDKPKWLSNVSPGSKKKSDIRSVNQQRYHDKIKNCDEFKDLKACTDDSKADNSWFSEISNMMASPEDSEEESHTENLEDEEFEFMKNSWEERKDVFLEKSSSTLMVDESDIIKGKSADGPLADASSKVNSKQENIVKKSVFVKPPTKRRKKKYY